MPVLICTILLFIVIAWLSFLYVKKINYFRKHIVPQQLKLVDALHEELESSKIKLSVCVGSDIENPQKFTLFEIAKFVEDNYRLSSEMYDNYDILFTTDNSQLLNFDTYITNPLLPKDIKEELKLFHNGAFKSHEKSSKPFFKIELPEESISAENTGNLYHGTGEAFENWATFKESADNLSFLIDQWIRENSIHQRQSENRELQF